MSEESPINHENLRRWHEAAGRRRSRRSFTGAPATAAQIEMLSDLCSNLSAHDDARVVFCQSPDVDVFRGVVGSYGKVTDAPHLLLMIASESSAASHQHVGYLGEAAVLEATALGLDTCWIGGFFSAQKVVSLVVLDPGERVVAVSPVGTAVDTLSLTERSFKSMAGSHSRKPLSQIAPGSTVWPAWAAEAADCVRIAPSAMNRQPWRLRFDDGSLIVAKDNPAETPKVTKALDCGIAMLHAQAGAAIAGAAGRWTDLTGDLDVAIFTPHDHRTDSR